MAPDILTREAKKMAHDILESIQRSVDRHHETDLPPPIPLPAALSLPTPAQGLAQGAAGVDSRR